MSHPYQIEEYMNQDSNLRFLKVSWSESGKDYSSEIPFDFLTDDLLGFVSLVLQAYPEKLLRTEGYQTLERLILRRKQGQPLSET